MTTYMDYMISDQPIRIFEPAVDPSRLRLRTIRIVAAGHLPGRTLQRQQAVFSHWAFVYITRGNGYYQVDDQERQRVGPGSFFCFYPGARFAYGPNSDGGWDEYYFTLEGSRIEEWLSSWKVEPGKVLQTGVVETLLSRVEAIFALLNNGSPANLDRAALLLESWVYELTLEDKDGESGGKQAAIAQVITDLGQSLHEAFDAVAFAAKHRISLSTLRRTVHAYTGFPLHEYVHRLKIAEAKGLLLNTSDTVKTIAERLGYADPFYFSRLFKKFAGLSPNQYRSRMGL